MRYLLLLLLPMIVLLQCHSSSMIQSDAILYTLSGISETPASIKSSCKADGRIFFMANGETLLEADIFLAPDCACYLFYEDGKHAYANHMTEPGLRFYTNVFEQIEQSNRE